MLTDIINSLNNEWIIQISSTFIGAFLAFLLAIWLDRKSRKKKYYLQLASLDPELKVNKASIGLIIEGLNNGFTLDKLVDSSVSSILNNPDLYEFGDEQLILRLHVYKKTILIANETINFCFKHWSEGVWEREEKVKATNIETLKEKFEMVNKSDEKLSKLL